MRKRQTLGEEKRGKNRKKVVEYKQGDVKSVKDEYGIKPGWRLKEHRGKREVKKKRALGDDKKKRGGKTEKRSRMQLSRLKGIEDD